MNNIERAKLFLEDIAVEYNDNKYKWKLLFYEKGKKWSDDLYHDTILKCYDSICKNGLDNKPKASVNYLFNSLLTNHLRSKKYAYNKNKLEVDDIEVYRENLQYEDPIRDSTWKDFLIKRVLETAEQLFSKQDFYLLKCKYILGKKESFLRTIDPHPKSTIYKMINILRSKLNYYDLLVEFESTYFV